MKVYQRENNSGGYYVANASHYEKLLKAGWVLTDYFSGNETPLTLEQLLPNDRDHLFPSILCASPEVNSFQEGVDLFFEVSGLDPEEAWCDCCGERWQFRDYP